MKNKLISIGISLALIAAMTVSLVSCTRSGEGGQAARMTHMCFTILSVTRIFQAYEMNSTPD